MTFSLDTLSHPGLRCLSVRQPWAWMITTCGKDVENRTWQTRYRGPVLLHAGVSASEMSVPALADYAARMPRENAFGGIVGYAEITDCVAASDSKWFFGPFGFVLAGARPLPFVACKGALNFFRPPVDVLERLRGLL